VAHIYAAHCMLLEVTDVVISPYQLDLARIAGVTESSSLLLPTRSIGIVHLVAFFKEKVVLCRLVDCPTQR
jgi:hypothetical protein